MAELHSSLLAAVITSQFIRIISHPGPFVCLTSPTLLFSMGGNFMKHSVVCVLLSILLLPLFGCTPPQKEDAVSSMLKALAAQDEEAVKLRGLSDAPCHRVSPGILISLSQRGEKHENCLHPALVSPWGRVSRSDYLYISNSPRYHQPCLLRWLMPYKGFSRLVESHEIRTCFTVPLFFGPPSFSLSNY